MRLESAEFPNPRVELAFCEGRDSPMMLMGGMGLLQGLSVGACTFLGVRRHVCDRAGVSSKLLGGR